MGGYIFSSLYFGNTKIADSEICGKSHAESHTHQKGDNFRERTEIFLWDWENLVNIRYDNSKKLGDYYIRIDLEGITKSSPKRGDYESKLHSEGIFSLNIPEFIGSLPNKKLVIDGGEKISHNHHISSIKRLTKGLESIGVDYLYVYFGINASPNVLEMINKSKRFKEINKKIIL